MTFSYVPNTSGETSTEDSLQAHATESKDESLSDKISSGELVYRIPKKKTITPPRATYSPEPAYSEEARRKKIKGTVLISLVVTAEGNVNDAQVNRGLDAELDRQALETVNRWKFQPAVRDGKPVPFPLIVEVDFRLY
jgi:TonB family protein